MMFNIAVMFKISIIILTDYQMIRASLSHDESDSRIILSSGTLSKSFSSDSDSYALNIDQVPLLHENKPETFYSSICSTENFNAILSCVMFSTCSVSMVVINKAIPMTTPKEERHNLPDTAIIFFHCFIAVILVVFAKYFKLIECEDLSVGIMKEWLPVNILFLAMLFTGFLSLVYSSLPIVTIFKNMTNLFTVAGDYYFFGEKVSVIAILSIFIMTFGAILAGLNDLEFSYLGYFWMILNCMFSSAYLLYLRHASSTIKLSKFGMVYYNNVLSTIILIPLLFIRQQAFFFTNPLFSQPDFIVFNILGGIIGFYLNFASLWCVSATSATTYAIIGSLNKVPTTLLGFVLFDAKMTKEGILFVIFATFGGFLFAYSKLPVPNNKLRT